MAARGERPEVIQRVTRNAKVSFTPDRYVKVFGEDVREAVQRSDRSVRSREGGASDEERRGREASAPQRRGA